MIQDLNSIKVKNNHIKPLNFDVIISAVSGDIDCITQIINHYSSYLRELATKRLFDEFGNEYHYVDETLRCQLENKLIKSVLKFKVEL